MKQRKQQQQQQQQQNPNWYVKYVDAGFVMQVKIFELKPYVFAIMQARNWQSFCLGKNN